MTNAVTLASMGNGPAFSAGRTGTQSLSSGWNKVQCNTEDFDTNSCYDNATNYRFQPTVAGYYQLSGAICFNSATGAYESLISMYKNGSEWKRGPDYNGISNIISISMSGLMYLNGSTDYAELYVYYNTTGNALSNSTAYTWFQGAMVRGA